MGRISRLGILPKVLIVGVVCMLIALMLGLRETGAPNATARTPFTSLAFAGQQYPAAVLDMSADLVFGQADFASKLAPNPPTANSFANPSAVIVDVTTGRLFVADTDNNRVLSWATVDEYQTGDPADIVLGQADFVSHAAPAPTASSLNKPAGLAFDDIDEMLYIADTGNNRVLSYHQPFSSGMAADVVIGQANFTSNAAPSPPTDASLSAPVGLTFDTRGNLVVADRDNNRVVAFEAPFENGMAASYLIGQPRSADGALNFVGNAAPNPPTSKSLNHPTAVAVDVLGEALYVADTGNNRVLAYDEASADETADRVIGQADFTSRVATAPPSATSLNGPAGITVDSANRLYVADTGNNRVLVYPDTNTNVAATVVFGQSDFTSAAAANPPDEASLIAPTGIAADGIIGVYIADRGNQRVLGYDQPLPNAQPRIASPRPATVRAGHGAFTLEVEGVGFITASKVQINGVERSTTFEDDALLTVPISAAEAASVGTLSIQVTTPAPGGGTSNVATLAFYAPAAGDTQADRVLGQRDFTHDESVYTPADATTLFNPSAVAINQLTGRLFVCDSNNSRVLSWASAAQFADGQAADIVIGQPDFTSSDLNDPDLGGPGADGSNFDEPMGLTLDASGNLYVADTYSNRVLIFQPPFTNGMSASKVIGQPNFTADDEPSAPSATNMEEPRGIAIGGDGTLYVTDSRQNRVLAFRNPLTSAAVADVVFGQPDFTADTANNGGISAASLNGPTHVALDSAGSLYVSDTNNNRVLVFASPLTSDAIADRVFGQPNFTGSDANSGGISASSLQTPLGLALDPHGALFIADSDNNRILAYANPRSGSTAASAVFGQHGSFTSNALPVSISAASLARPAGMAFDTSGNLLVADFAHSRVLGYDRPASSAAIYLPLLQK